MQAVCEEHRRHRHRRAMFEQSGTIHRYWGAEHHHGYHGHHPTNTHGSATTNVERAEDYGDRHLQRWLDVSLQAQARGYH